jgi:hypothetical protein
MYITRNATFTKKTVRFVQTMFVYVFVHSTQGDQKVSVHLMITVKST